MFYIIILTIINYITAFENIKKTCSSCTYFIPNEINPKLGLCKLFENNLAIYCCDNENLCSKNRIFYEPKDIDSIVWSYHKWVNNNNKLLQEKLNKINKLYNNINNNELLQEQFDKLYNDNNKLLKKQLIKLYYDIDFDKIFNNSDNDKLLKKINNIHNDFNKEEINEIYNNKLKKQLDIIYNDFNKEEYNKIYNDFNKEELKKELDAIYKNNLNIFKRIKNHNKVRKNKI